MMNNIMKFLLVALFVAIVPFSSTQAEEGNKYSGLSIAVVDVQKILKEATAAQDIDKQLGEIRKNFQAEIEKEEKELRAAEKKILSEKDKLKEEELKAKALEFQKRVGVSQKKVQDRKNKLDKALADAVSKLRSEIVRVVAEIGDKNNLDLVLARTDVVIVSKEIDVTDEVLKRINKDLPSVKVSVK